MKWSQLKKRIEATFAESVSGRVEVWNTRYRNSHDSEGEAWITIDKQMVFKMPTYTFFVEEYNEQRRLQEARGCDDYSKPDQLKNYQQTLREAEQAVHDQGIYNMWEVNGYLFDYLNLSIDKIAHSENGVIRAFGMLDRRFGKRRLLAVEESEQHLLVKMLYRFRCEAEGLEPVT